MQPFRIKLTERWCLHYRGTLLIIFDLQNDGVYTTGAHCWLYSTYRMTVSRGRLLIMATDVMTDKLPAHTTFLPLAATWGLSLLDRPLESGETILLPLAPSRDFLVVQVHPGGQASVRRDDDRRHSTRTPARRLIRNGPTAPCHILRAQFHSTTYNHIQIIAITWPSMYQA
jgi:hypothetical protein